MKRSLLLVLTAALLGLGLLAGCGGDDGPSQKDEFDTAFNKVNTDFVKLGEDVQQTIQTAEGKPDDELATKFKSLSDQVLAIKARLTGLDAPGEYSKDVDRLAASMQVVAVDLGEIAEAAENGQAAEAKSQVQELVRHSVETRTARRALARKTGAET
jgi:outer membrane murein-binding lipoprotein Lpp